MGLLLQVFFPGTNTYTSIDPSIYPPDHPYLKPFPPSPPFLFQALCLNIFNGSKYEMVISKLELDSPGTIAKNLYALVGMAATLAVAQVLGLKFLHREKR